MRLAGAKLTVFPFSSMHPTLHGWDDRCRFHHPGKRIPPKNALTHHRSLWFQLIGETLHLHVGLRQEK